MEDDRIDRVGTDIQEKATVIWNVANAIFGIFKPHEYGKVILPMTVIKRFHDCLAASARSSNMKVFMDTIFKDIFEHAAMDCYVKSMEGFENLMQDDDKRTRLRELMAQAFYRRFRTAYTLPDKYQQSLVEALNKVRVAMDEMLENDAHLVYNKSYFQAEVSCTIWRTLSFYTTPSLSDSQLDDMARQLFNEYRELMPA